MPAVTGGGREMVWSELSELSSFTEGGFKNLHYSPFRNKDGKALHFGSAYYTRDVEEDY